MTYLHLGRVVGGEPAPLSRYAPAHQSSGASLSPSRPAGLISMLVGHDQDHVEVLDRMAMLRIALLSIVGVVAAVFLGSLLANRLERSNDRPMVLRVIGFLSGFLLAIPGLLLCLYDLFVLLTLLEVGLGGLSVPTSADETGTILFIIAALIGGPSLLLVGGGLIAASLGSHNAPYSRRAAPQSPS